MPQDLVCVYEVMRGTNGERNMEIVVQVLYKICYTGVDASIEYGR
jgi:hypothetical protein